MKKIIFLTAVIIGFLRVVKDDVIDGRLSIGYVNMTTYDFLKSHPQHLFDTTLMIIDKAGLKDKVNAAKTFFVPTNYSIRNFLLSKQQEIRKQNEKLNFNIDSLFKYYTPKMLQDSMSVYFFSGRITRDDLTEAGTIYQTEEPSTKLLATLEQSTSNDYLVDGIISQGPKFIYLTKIIGERDIMKNGSLNDPSGNTKLNDIRVLCQTTGLLTNTGVIHVLNNTHIWAFRR
ncbi:hypothetical protein [Sphingobacterium sp. IITKGP-BTPF85]|uniref:hypothetical protein n=1 Tax=Sphingobacterium sp. IITKGP-BTPF85 TaxID=1338009 RepID=UPI00038A0C8D|nr:hypothetical protein [Sphingobacterium sp. IITKGP-BTPF85]KKX51031.1 hypothetical protein L950_0207280 [Sphingobacterium sp. IITKGP-BTPF85]